jgi:chain length determinant protein (polysaccharide antigen chain regulator)
MAQESSSYNQHHNNNELNLFELFFLLWSQKKLIVLITLASLFTGTCYVFLSTPIYQSQMNLPPPLSNNSLFKAQTLNFFDSKYSDNSKKYTDQYAYAKFISILNSQKTKDLFSQHKSWDSFKGILATNMSKKTNNQPVTITLQTDSSKNSTSWLNEYTSFTMNLTSHRLTTEITTDVALWQSQLDLAINSRRKLFMIKLNIEIEKLSEALSIAKMLNLTTPFKNNSIINENNGMIDEIRRLYSPGIKALQAEIKTLNARKDNDIFIPELTQLLYDRKILTSLQITPYKFISAKTELKVQINETPIKPEKPFILGISLLLGIMLGCLIALIRGHKKVLES